MNRADRIKDFRPISLYNTIYKMAAKVITNRSNVVLSDLFAINQKAFFPNRSITDNIITVFEALHSLKNKNKYVGKEGWYALKLDMGKIYNRVKWVFLRELFRKMGFHVSFIGLVMERVLLRFSTL